MQRTSWPEMAALLAEKSRQEAVLAFPNGGDILINVAGEEVTFALKGSVIEVRIPSFEALAWMLETEPLRAEGSQYLEQLSELLTTSSLSAEVYVADRRLARLGAERQPGSIARLIKASYASRAPVPASIVTVREKQSRNWVLVGLVSLLVGSVVYWKMGSR